MKRIILTAAVVTVFTGCGNKETPIENDNARLSHHVNVFCDKQQGVEYLVYNDYKAGGMTVRYTQDGTVSTCNK